MAFRELSPQLEELVQGCVELSKHPERRDDIIRHTKTVVLGKHRMERFWRDVEVIQWEATSSVTSRTVDLTTIPKHRDILQIGVPGIIKPLEKLGIDAILPGVSRGKTNCWYVLGHALHVKTAAPHNELLIAMLGKPDVTDTKFYSWIAETYGNGIVEEVASIIFGECGQTDKQRLYADRVAQLHNPEIMREELLSADSSILNSGAIHGD